MTDKEKAAYDSLLQEYWALTTNSQHDLNKYLNSSKSQLNKGLKWMSLEVLSSF
jgi:hypothetical protein